MDPCFVDCPNSHFEHNIHVYNILISAGHDVSKLERIRDVYLCDYKITEYFYRYLSRYVLSICCDVLCVYFFVMCFIIFLN